MNAFTQSAAEAMAETQLQQVQLSDEERQPCEVWTRVMGYHRPVASFNTGKKGEHKERRFFVERA
jgi:anaerobic ribonucleoside-triphosphate reductase